MTVKVKVKVTGYAVLAYSYYSRLLYMTHFNSKATLTNDSCHIRGVELV